ncbi:hypothetical protein PC129_g24158 [Phytophthora cactorum]|uniref:Uncharacterized protein n=1 Tax=Phytophthora cactorum TaxID=29920 RepID=A0A8T1GYW4_9STRA|nr:hypothetical protein Pcac1_g20831 [Phytophthora cactorum]KAG2767699.1 hypothetical protein Pcac1_g20832 [Phytophthora cactorum]KAG2778175.1 hypothetical protein Pcac1_g11416 [Phytophthora cactorum]KAG2778178.1 hypothetical protein Pcac1_g11415 [Phytophthora cactorum]KAG2875877.1 hypothetical protein PC114_g24483 [Phytophthora cactorum]
MLGDDPSPTRCQYSESNLQGMVMFSGDWHLEGAVVHVYREAILLSGIVVYADYLDYRYLATGI